MEKIKDKIFSLYIPWFLPWIMAFTVFWCMPKLVTLNKTSGINLDGVFMPVFEFSLFFSGLLFTIYVIILGPSKSFIEKILHTNAMAQFHHYVRLSIWTNMITTVSTTYYLVTGFPESTNWWERIIITGWLLLTVYAFCCVIRVVYTFLLLVHLEITHKKSD